MTRIEYNEIMLGSPITEVTRCYGEPYRVCNIGNGATRYEFIEKISMNNELVVEYHYYLTVVNGHVVNKSVCEENRPAYDQLFREDPNYPTYP